LNYYLIEELYQYYDFHNDVMVNRLFEKYHHMFVDPEYIRNGNQFELIISPIAHLSLCMHVKQIRLVTYKQYKGKKERKRRINSGNRKNLEPISLQ
jgi:hypothetical protein